MDAQDVLTPLHGLECVYDLGITMVTCMSTYCTDYHVYYGIQSHFYNQTQHTDSYDCVRMHVYMHFAFKELRMHL